MLRIVPLDNILIGSDIERQWGDLIGPDADIFYKIHYLRIAQQAEEGKILLATYLVDGFAIYYPFVLRPIRHLQQAEFCAGTLYYDIMTPYEYGGPVLNSPGAAALMKPFLENFRVFCRRIGVVSEFMRLHPFAINHELLQDDFTVRESCQNIVVDLTLDEEEIIENYDSCVRKDIRQGIRRGTVIKREKLTNIDEFVAPYLETMRRVNASARYYFTEQYFRMLSECSEDDIWLYHSLGTNGEIAASALFLKSSDYCHYFLCGRRVLPRSIYVNNNFFFHKVIMDAQKSGCRYLHLGGASNFQRGLIKFKQGFSDFRAGYYTASHIHDDQAYHSLRNDLEDNYPETTMLTPAPYFFPKYREGMRGEFLDWKDCPLPDGLDSSFST